MQMDKEKIKLGIAPINWTNDDMPDLGSENTFEQCISEMALAGYSGCEVGNKFPRNPEVLKKALSLRGLQVCNAWYSFYLTTRSLEEEKKAFLQHVQFLQAMGASIVNGAEQGNSCQGQLEVPVFEGKGVFSQEEWERMFQGLNELGKIAKAHGLTLAYHHHMGTGVESIAETDTLMENTDPDWVSLCYDTGHFYFAGEDYLAALKKHIGRVKHVHLKDVRGGEREKAKGQRLSFLDSVRSGVFTVPGDGILDYPAVFQILHDHGYEGWMVVEAEQDPAKANPFEYALKARNYIRETAGL